MMELQIEYISTKQLTPYDKNTRKHETFDVDQIAKSIEKFGFSDPIGIWGDNNIIVTGHGRWQAAKKLKIKEVPCIRLDHLDDEQRRQYAIAHNKTAELSHWNIHTLAEELESVDMSDFNFDFSDLFFDKKKTIEDDDYEIKPQKTEPRSKYGDIYQLGNHRLMCGDSTNWNDVELLMGGKQADMIITDPPYNVDIENSDGLKIKNDNMKSNEFYEFLCKCFQNCYNALKPGGAFYIWYASCETINFYTAANTSGLEVHEELIWNKNSFTFGHSDYQWKHEPCMYGWKDGASHYFIDDRTQSTVIDDFSNLSKFTKEQLITIVKNAYDSIPMTIIDADKPTRDSLHPTMKPIELFAKQIKNSSRINERVLDLFGGSGTTIIACEQLGRKAYTMEYDPQFVDVIIDRWEEYTGKKAVLINGSSSN